MRGTGVRRRPGEAQSHVAYYKSVSSVTRELSEKHCRQCYQTEHVHTGKCFKVTRWSAIPRSLVTPLRVKPRSVTLLPHKEAWHAGRPVCLPDHSAWARLPVGKRPEVWACAS